MYIVIYKYNILILGRYNMALVANVLNNLIPVSNFNKGQASKIFDRLSVEKELIVLKNNQPSAVILSTDEYLRLTEIEEEYFLLLEANKRIESNTSKKTISMSEIMSNLGITDAELLESEDVDIE
ncbi:prevent-host-death family protein [Catonella morbi ATCC 51271]|uniref:Antitoxin n=2 Tax=Catonella TaxID=43996 RepID=V2ZC31_9FIRM|nr:prevent-host-death family protein [Catonella morbi ATCC 51271]